MSKYLACLSKSPSQTLRTFLRSHARALTSIDFVVPPIATYRFLLIFIVLHYKRGQIVHFGVTANPTPAWVAQQVTEEFLWDNEPRYPIPNRDSICDALVCVRIKAMGIEDVSTAPQSRLQSPFAEGMIGCATAREAPSGGNASIT